MVFNQQISHVLNRPNPPDLCFKTRVGAQPLIWKSFFILMKKTHFHKKGCAPCLILKVRVFGTRKWPIPTTLTISKAKYKIFLVKVLFARE